MRLKDDNKYITNEAEILLTASVRPDLETAIPLHLKCTMMLSTEALIPANNS